MSTRNPVRPAAGILLGLVLLAQAASAQVPIHPQTDGTLPEDSPVVPSDIGVIDRVLGPSMNVSGLIVPGEFTENVPPGLEGFPFDPTRNTSATLPDTLPDGTLPPDIVGPAIGPPAGPQGPLDALDDSWREMPITDSVTGQPIGGPPGMSIPLPKELQLPPPAKTP